MKLVIESKGIPATTSRIIAQEFGMQHKDVLQVIRNLLGSIKDTNFSRRNFTPRDFKTERGKIYNEYIIAEDGAMLLIMGFTGEKAIQIKLQFIKAFRDLEAKLEASGKTLSWREIRGQSKELRLDLTDTIKDFVEYAANQGSSSAKMYYMNITKMEYKALELLSLYQNNPQDNFRSSLSASDLGHIITAETIAKGAIQKGMNLNMKYKDIYKMAKEEVEAFANLVNCYKPKLNLVKA